MKIFIKNNRLNADRNGIITELSDGETEGLLDILAEVIEDVLEGKTKN